MAEECSASSVATSSPTPPNWWPDLHHHAISLSSWPVWQNPNASSSNCDDDVSISTSNFTTASNHSSLTIESCRRLVDPPPPDFIAEDAPDTHIWTHVLSSHGSNGDHVQNTSQDAGGIYEPPFDYLKKMDSNWEFPSNPLSSSSSLINNLDKNQNGFADCLNIDNHRLTNKLSNLQVNCNWSIAPPDPHPNYTPSPGFLSSLYGHDNLKAENEFGPFNGGDGNNGAYQIGLHPSAAMEVDRNYGNCYGLAQSPCTSSVTSSYSNNSGLTKPLIDIHESKPCFKPSAAPCDSNYKKQSLQTSPPMTSKQRNHQGNSNSAGTEGKKKRSEDYSETSVKKPKQEGSAVSSVKMQAPKVKLGDKITALQQIVSPFGKTDTASVLLEAIGYIKFLQEQVQLLSNPYMKTNSHKDPWGSLGRKEKLEEQVKFDLRGRGLCLVPISCTPQVYRENSGSDYWTPTYRGCLYR